nr:hypothetical protein [Nocardia australiensis]
MLERGKGVVGDARVVQELVEKDPVDVVKGVARRTSFIRMTPEAAAVESSLSIMANHRIMFPNIGKRSTFLQDYFMPVELIDQPP